MKLLKGSKFTKEFFDPESRPTKAKLVEWISNEHIPGMVIGGEPYVDVCRFVGMPQSGEAAGDSKTTYLDLLT